MTVLTQFFCKMYFLYVSQSRKKKLAEFLWVLPLQKSFFPPTPGSSSSFTNEVVQSYIKKTNDSITISSRSSHEPPHLKLEPPHLKLQNRWFTTFSEITKKVVQAYIYKANDSITISSRSSHEPPHLKLEPPHLKNATHPGKKVSLTPKKVKMRPQKKGFPRIHHSMDILQKTRSNLVYLGLWSLISDLHPHIGGHHPVLYFTTQITEKYSTAMC